KLHRAIPVDASRECLWQLTVRNEQDHRCAREWSSGCQLAHGLLTRDRDDDGVAEETGIEALRRIPAIDHECPTEVAGRPRRKPQPDVTAFLVACPPQRERLLHDNLPGTVRHALEVAALVTCGLKAEPLELARDVPGGPGKAFGAGTTSLHGIVGEDVEARHEIALTDL